jgi:hypothetical protein
MGSVQLSQTRTLARFGTSSQLLPPFLLFKHLRVLIIEISQANRQSSSLLDFNRICHLFQLRCLKIVAKDYDVVLPSKIGGWQQLETFEIQIERFPRGPIFEITIRYCSLEPVIAFDCSRGDNIA